MSSLMNRRSIILGCAGIGLLLGSRGEAAPQPRMVSPSWQLDFTFHDPQRITLTLPGDSHPTTFWYLLYEVTNRTGRDVAFYPSFRLVTDTLDVVEGGANIHPRVYDGIAARYRKTIPFFTPPAQIMGPLLQGEENSRVSAAVFRMFDPQASRFTIYVSGLSGELVRVSEAAVENMEGVEQPGALLLRRTLALTYDLPGDTTTSRQAHPIRRNRQWVMR